MKLKIVFVALIGLCVLSLNAQITNRIYTFGNSVTDGINFGGFQSIGNQKGNSHLFGRHMIPGSPLFLLYDSPTGGFTESPYGYWPTALANYDWDCISFQPFDRGINGSDGDLTTIEKWTTYIKANRSNVDQLQLYIYSRYPRVPQGKTYQNATAHDWNKLWLGTYGSGGQSTEEKSYFINLMNAVRDANLMPKPASLIPCGDVMYALNQKMQAGNFTFPGVNTITGLNSIWDFYGDGIHVNNMGSFMLGATFFATMYKQDPRGITVPSAYGTISNAIRDTILNTIYDVVFNHPYSGTSLADIVPPNGVSISPKNTNLTFLQSFKLIPTVTPASASNKNVSWASSNTAVATVDLKGKVIGVGTGITSITGTTNIGGFTDTAIVTVSGLAHFTSVAGVLMGWNFQTKLNTALGFNATFANSNIVTTGGISFATIGIGLSIRSDGFGNGSLMASNQTTKDLISSLGADEYFTFRIKPKDGKLINVTKVSFATKSEGGGHIYVLMSSVKGFNTSQILASVTGGFNQMNNFNITGHQNISQEVEFRVYVYNLTSNQYTGVGIGEVSGNDFQIEGAVISPLDDQSPSTVLGIVASVVKDTGFLLSWEESTDNMVVWGYNIYNNGVKLNTELLKETSYQFTGLISGSINNVSVTSVDFVGNQSAENGLTVITNTKPIAMLNISILSGLAPFIADFNSIGSSDPDTGAGDFVLGFDWDFGNGQIASSNSAQIVYSTPGIYTVSLRVVDNRELRSDYVYATVTVLSEMIAPTPPTAFNTLSRKNTSLVITFAGATDNVAVTGYLVSVNGAAFGLNSIATIRTITGLAAATNYQIGIRAVDASGNISIPALFTAQTNFNPIAVISVNSLTGIVPFNLSVTGLASTDVDNDALTYSWTLSGQKFTTTGFAFNLTTSGNYTVSLKVSDGNGGIATASSLINVTSITGSVTGIDFEISSFEKFIIYPNPSNVDKIYFNISTAFQIIDMEGKLIMEATQPVSEVWIGDLKAGIYSVKTKNRGVHKLIKL